MSNNGGTKQNFDLIIKGGTVATLEIIEECDIGIKDGKISALGTLTSTNCANLIDAKGLHVLPGVIDSQVHFLFVKELLPLQGPPKYFFQPFFL